MEKVDEPNYVWIRDCEGQEWRKRILICDLGERFLERYIAVSIDSEEMYLKGGSGIAAYTYRQMKPIDPTLERIEELEKELAELKQQVNK
jgi:hypothetical protein